MDILFIVYRLQSMGRNFARYVSVWRRSSKRACGKPSIKDELNSAAELNMMAGKKPRHGMDMDFRYVK